MKSHALVLKTPGVDPEVVEIDVSPPGPGEVTVRMAASGVCGTDGHTASGLHTLSPFPIVLGHEGAGVVETCGPGVTALVPGDHVVLTLSTACRDCRQCLRDLPQHCNSPSRRKAGMGMMDDGRTRAALGTTPLYPLFGIGTLSEYATVREAQAIRVDPSLPLRELCLAGCGVVTGLGAALNIAQTSVGDTVVVIGCGGVGVNVVQGARIAGASTIIAVDPIPERVELAKQLGATHGTNDVADVADFVKRIEPTGADIVFEVAGIPDVIAESVKLTRVGGTCVMVAGAPDGTTIPLKSEALFANRRIVGCRGGAVIPQRDIARVELLYRTGQLRLRELIGEVLPLTAATRALTNLGVSSFARSVIAFD